MVEGVVRRMKAAREQRDISREEAAVALRVDFSTIGRWERLQTKDGPPLWAVVAYGRLTGKPLVELLGEDAPKEALDAALMQMLLDRIKRFDRDWGDLQAQIGQLLARDEPDAK